jgi:Ca2+-binding EF-hand superfamily protein
MGKKVFSLIDSNNDESLSKEEVDDFYIQRFNKMDADSDGLVTKQEVTAFRKKQRFMRMDSNGDGVITENEMAISRQSHRKSGRRSHH